MTKLDTIFEALTCIEDVPPQVDREHSFVDEYLSDREIESIMSACVKAEDVHPAQVYFAYARRDGIHEALTVLEEMVDGYPVDVIRIPEVRLGVPVFRFLS